MSQIEDKKPAPTQRPPGVPQTQTSTGGKEDSGVPVRLVYFDRPLQYRGRQSSVQEKTGKEGSLSWALHFIPSIRQLRITFTNTSNPEKSGVSYVPAERLLSWEPGQ